MGEPAPPQRYVIRKPSGDPAAARRLAAAYDECADDVVAELRHVSAVLDGLGVAWRGDGARSAWTPEQVLSGDGARLARALHRSADDLRRYAHELARAHEHHGWSLGRLVTLGAVVTVGVAAVVVTVGAAAPAEAAAAAAVVEGAEAATAAAGAASTSAAAGLSSWQALLTGIRPLAPFVVPHLVSSGVSVGLDAVTELPGQHRLDPHSLEVAAAVGFAGSATGRAVESALAASRGAVRRLAEAGVWTANGTAAGYADDGEVDPLDSLSCGLTGLIARDVRFGVDEARLLWKLRVPQLPLGFESKGDWRRFVTTLYDGLDEAGYRDAVAIFHGSSVTGVSWETGIAFDVGRRSDYDIALVHAGLLTRAGHIGVPLRWQDTRTAELWPRSVRRLGLRQLQRDLSKMLGRPVNFMIYVDRETATVRSFIEVPTP